MLDGRQIIKGPRADLILNIEVSIFGAQKLRQSCLFFAE